MNDISDATILLRRYRWELIVHEFVDIMQVAFQVILFTSTSTFLWIFLIPHVISISMIFGFFAASDDSARSTSSQKTITAAQLFKSITLLSDSILTLLIVYALVECAAYGKTLFNAPLLFGANLCQGPRYNGGFLQAIELVFAIGSVYLQTNQLMTLEKVASIQSPNKKNGLTLVVISIALSMYTISYLSYGAKYFLLSFDIFALVVSGMAMFLQFALPTTQLTHTQKMLRVIDLVLFSFGWITNLGMVAYVISDKVSLCNVNSDAFATCSIPDTVSVVMFCIVVFVRIITQIVYRFITVQTPSPSTKIAWKRK